MTRDIATPDNIQNIDTQCYDKEYEGSLLNLCGMQSADQHHEQEQGHAQFHDKDFLFGLKPMIRDFHTFTVSVNASGYTAFLLEFGYGKDDFHVLPRVSLLHVLPQPG